MTREEFIREVNDWYELRQVAYDYDCYDVYENILDEDEKDEWFTMQVHESWAGMPWYDLLDELNSIPNGHDWYIKDRYGDVEVADDDDFADFRDSLLDFMETNELFDDSGDDSDENEEESSGERPKEGFEEEEQDPEWTNEQPGFSTNELFAYCAGVAQAVS